VCCCQRHVKLPTWRTSDLERSNSRHQVSLTSEMMRANLSEKLSRILPKVATSPSLLGSFTCRKFTTWDRRLYFPSEGRRAVDFFARKIRRLRPGLNPRTWVPKASTFTSRAPKPLITVILIIIFMLTPVNYAWNLSWKTNICERYRYVMEITGSV